MRAFKCLEQTLVCILLTFIDVDLMSLSVLFKKIFWGFTFTSMSQVIQSLHLMLHVP